MPVLPSTAQHLPSGLHPTPPRRRRTGHFLGGDLRDAAEDLVPPEWARPSGALRLSGQITAPGVLLDIVAMLAQPDRCGTLLVTSGDATRAVRFERSILIGAATTKSDERIGEYLRKGGDLSTDELETAIYLAAIENRPVGELLVETQHIDRWTLEQALQLQAEEVFFAAMRVEEGAFCLFESLDLARIPNASRSLLSLLMEATRRTDDHRGDRRSRSVETMPAPAMDPSEAERQPGVVRDDPTQVVHLELEVMSAVHRLVQADRVVGDESPVRSTEDVLRITNTLLRDVHRRCEGAGVGDPLRAELAMFVATTGHLARMLREVALFPDGSLDAESVLRHGNGTARDELLESALRGYARMAAESARTLIAGVVGDTGRPCSRDDA